MDEIEYSDDCIVLTLEKLNDFKRFQDLNNLKMFVRLSNSARLITLNEAERLATIEDYAEKNKINSIVVVGENIVNVDGRCAFLDLSGYVKRSDITSVVRYKGSVWQYTDLPSENVTNGDMYNVISADADNGVNAGDNVVWVADENRWDIMSGFVSLEHLVEKREGYGLSKNDFSDELKAKVERSTAVSVEPAIFNGVKIADVVVDGVTIPLFGAVRWEDIEGKPNSFSPSEHDHNDMYYTEAEIDNKLEGKQDTIEDLEDIRSKASSALQEHQDISGKANVNHNHNDLYYAKSEVDDKIASATPTLTWDNILNKPTSYPPSSHTHDYASSSHNHDSVYQAKGSYASADHTHNSYLTGITKAMVTNALGYTPPTSDTNTWRGIQNNLTSDSTTDSLSAYQGKVLKGLVDGKAASSHSHSQYLTSHQDISGKANTSGTYSGLSVGYASSAGSVAWTNVSGRPTIVAKKDSSGNIYFE